LNLILRNISCSPAACPHVLRSCLGKVEGREKEEAAKLEDVGLKGDNKSFRTITNLNYVNEEKVKFPGMLATIQLRDFGHSHVPVSYLKGEGL
jgi:hypothetical protein